MSEEHQSHPRSESPVIRQPVHRTPKLRPFLGTGVVLGAIVGALLDFFGPGSSCGEGPWGPAGTCRADYQATSSLAYFVVLGALVGLAVAAILAALLAGRQSKR